MTAVDTAAPVDTPEPATAFIATTESGAEYLIDLGERYWMHRRNGWERISRFKVVDRDQADLTWDVIRDLPQATEPVIGKAVYLSSRDVWRLSTDIVSIEVTTTEEIRAKLEKELSERQAAWDAAPHQEPGVNDSF